MDRPTLALLGLVLAALAVVAGAQWVDDGDGTCAALYRPNLDRRGCVAKLTPRALATAGLSAGAVLAWDAAARRAARPGRRTVAGVATGLAAAVVVLAAGALLDRRGGAGAVTLPPVPVATSAPAGFPPDVRPPTSSRP